MRALIFFLILFSCAFSLPAHSQVTAVMQARVEIISGSGISAIQQPLIDLKNSDTLNAFNTGSFSLTTTPGTNVQIRLESSTPVVNEWGEEIEFEFFNIDQFSDEDGKHEVNLTAKLKQLQNFKGQYKGSVTAVVEYL